VAGRDMVPAPARRALRSAGAGIVEGRNGGSAQLPSEPVRFAVVGFMSAGTHP
jgi:hypothetical protein